MSATTVVRERPIPFSGEMVRAILAGRKSVTRRVIRNPDSYENIRNCAFCCPYGSPGERLWIREAWRYAGSSWSGETPTIRAHAVEYAADGKYSEHYLPADFEAVPPHVCRCKDSDEHREQLLRRHSRVRPPMFMPRWASRLTLELDEVRVERLQEITEEGARAEGMEPRPDEPMGFKVLMSDGRAYDTYGAPKVGDSDSTGATVVGVAANSPFPGAPARDIFARGWDTLNGKRAPWASNPWVWVLRFHVVPQEVAGA